MTEIIYYTLWLTIFTIMGLWILQDPMVARVVGYSHLFIRFYLYCRFLMFMGTAPVFYTFITLTPETATTFYTEAPDRIMTLAEEMWGVEGEE